MTNATGSLHAVPAPDAPWTGSVAEETGEELRARYDAYCRAQRAALPGLLPRDQVRAIYREARQALADQDPVEDPLTLLADWCGRLLPLPPFDVWRDDYRRNPTPYREAAGEPAAAPTRAAPVTVDLRTLDHGGLTWYAGLDVFRDGDQWRGVIAFHTGEGERPHRTGEVFRGDSHAELRDRFLSFDDATLAAFLRSVLP